MEKTKKNMIPFIVAIVLGIVSVITVNKYITTKTEIHEAKNVKILIAKNAINQGDTITLDDLGTKLIPLTVVSEVNITVSSDGGQDINTKKAMVAGRISTRAIPAGDPVFWSDFRKPQLTRLANKIPADSRAVTIPVDSLSAVGFNIVPGDHVDIFATSTKGCGDLSSAMSMDPQLIRNLADTSPQSIQKKKTEPSTYVLMQDVLVLAVAQDFNTYTTIQNRKMTYSNITLKVTIYEALMLTHAKSQVTLSCILRSPASIDRIPTKKMFPVDCTSLKEKYIYKFDKERADRIIIQVQKAIKQKKSEKSVSQSTSKTKNDKIKVPTPAKEIKK